jgi:hypothetical protein
MRNVALDVKRNWLLRTGWCAIMKSKRSKAKQNLLVAAVNAALEQELITLQCSPVVSAQFNFVIAGFSAVGYVSDAGFDEVFVNTIVCPTELGWQDVSRTISHKFQKFGAATAFAWLERRTGKYLQSTYNYHGTKAVTNKLSELTIAPCGYGTKPTKDGYDFHKECDAVFGVRNRKKSFRAGEKYGSI